MVPASSTAYIYCIVHTYQLEAAVYWSPWAGSFKAILELQMDILLLAKRDQDLTLCQEDKSMVNIPDLIVTSIL